MKYVDEFRDHALARKLVAEIRRTVTRPWTIMEVCGGQTHTIVKYGIDRLLPGAGPRGLWPAEPGFAAAPAGPRGLSPAEPGFAAAPGVELVHGPGCPVCVTPLEMIDRAHAIASRPDVIFCSFGDMLRVPGSRGDLFALKSRG